MIGALIRAGRRHGQFVTDGPKTQQTNAELTLQSLRAVGLEAALYGIADVRRHVAKIRFAFVVARHTFAIVFNGEEMFVVLAPARDRDCGSFGVNRIFHHFGDSLERIALR